MGIEKACHNDNRQKVKKMYQKYLKENQPREEMLKVSCKTKMTNGSVLKGSRKFKAPP